MGGWRVMVGCGAQNKSLLEKVNQEKWGGKKQNKCIELKLIENKSREG